MTKLILVVCPKCKARAYVYNYGSNPHRVYSWSKGKNRGYARHASHVKGLGRCMCGTPYVKVNN